MSPRRVLVTGGAGFIGSHLVERLVQSGYRVTVLDDLSTGSLDNLADARERGEVHFREGSVLDAGAVREAMRECDAVFHLAVQGVRRSIGLPLENHDVNATGTLRVLEEARRARIQRFVYCSSSEVYGNGEEGVLKEDSTVCRPVTVYGAAKLAGEHYSLAYLRTYGLPVVVARPFNSYGPREHDRGDLAEVIPRFVIRVVNGLPPVIFGDGSNGRDFTYVTETAAALASLAVTAGIEGTTINLAYGRLVTIREVAHVVAAVCGRPELAPIFVDARPGDVHRLHANTQRAERLLSFKARIDLHEGLKSYVKWFREAYDNPADLLEPEIRNWRMPS